MLNLHDKNQLKKKDFIMTTRGHCRIKPPLTTIVIDKINKAFNKTTIYQDKNMMVRATIQQKIRVIKNIIIEVY